MLKGNVLYNPVVMTGTHNVITTKEKWGRESAVVPPQSALMCADKLRH